MVKTIDLKGNQYAQVKTRIIEFRTANPNGLIETTPTVTDTHVIFKARILKDKADQNSAEATGHSYGAIAKTDKEGKTVEKVFEKQETIAVGRALALLGYGADGEIASSEEMEEFLAHQEEERAEAIADWTERIEKVKTSEELKLLWSEMPPELKLVLEVKKNEMKAILTTEKV